MDEEEQLGEALGIFGFMKFLKALASTCQKNYLGIPHRLGARARTESKDAKGLAMLLAATRGWALLAFSFS